MCRGWWFWLVGGGFVLFDCAIVSSWEESEHDESIEEPHARGSELLQARGDLSLFLEQVRVRAGANSTQNQISTVNFVNQQPVRFNMALSVVPVISGQCVVTVLFGKRFFFQQHGNDFFSALRDFFPV